jgi:enoyl-CoA hydratase/carnithine racemase
MSTVSNASVAAIFQPDPEQPVRALVVAGACGNVGFGKVGQFARVLSKHGVPVIALDLSEAVKDVPAKLRAQLSKRFDEAQVDAMLGQLTTIQGSLDDIPDDTRIGFVFEAIPERLTIKRSFYKGLRARDPDAYVFSATSGLTTRHLYEGLAGADRSGVMHPFFPHLTNKLWEVPTSGGTTSDETLSVIRRFLSTLGMSVMETRDVPAFAADRLFCGMMLEAVRIVDSTDLTPAQVDDVCRKLMGTSPFYVHNLIPGANYLSAHCMELMAEECASSLFAIPDSWKPYVEDPHKQWPYERGQKCPPERFEEVRGRMLGMMFSLTAYMVEHEIAGVDVINFLAENALAFRSGPPAMIVDMGFEAARALTKKFLEAQGVSNAAQVAPIEAIAQNRQGWDSIYVGTSVHDGVGLISLKRRTINHVFVAQLDAAYESLQANDDVKAIVIAPDGALSREFGHGADPNCFVPVLGKHEQALGLIQGWKKTLSKLRRGKPTVAALVGRVLGGSNELASCCTARIAAEGTKLGQPEPTVGVLPGLGGCNHIHRFSDPAHYARINELLLTGHLFAVDEAVEWGFVSKTVPVRKLPGASMAFAAALADGSEPTPTFREGPLEVSVARDVGTANEAGVALDAELRELIASTIEQANNLPYPDATALEERRAADSLTLSSSAIGVKAMLRGKAPAFENPLG